MPDFDIDFDDHRRGRGHPHVTDKYGADRVAQIATFGRLKARPRSRTPRGPRPRPFAMADRITRAPPAT